MTLRLIDGFEIYGSAGSSVGINLFNGRYPNVNYGNGTLNIVAGRLGGSAMQWSGSTFTTPTFTSQTTWIVGFAFRNNSLPAGDNAILDFMDSNTIQTSLYFNGTTRVFKVVNGLGTVLGTGTTVLNTLDFYYIELKIVIDNSSGVVQLKINTVDEINVTGQKTQQSGNSSANNFIFHSANSFGAWAIDDLYILDNQGSRNNTFLGDVIVEAISPVATGSNTNWTPTSGSLNYACAANRDQTLVNTTSTVNAKDTYKCGALSRIGSSIAGTCTNVFTKNSDSTNHTMATVIHAGGSDYNGSTQTVSSTGFKWLSNVNETNPNTSTTWTVSDVNTAEFGMILLS